MTPRRRHWESRRISNRPHDTEKISTLVAAPDRLPHSKRWLTTTVVPPPRKTREPGPYLRCFLSVLLAPPFALRRQSDAVGSPPLRWPLLPCVRWFPPREPSSQDSSRPLRLVAALLQCPPVLSRHLHFYPRRPFVSARKSRIQWRRLSAQAESPRRREPPTATSRSSCAQPA